MYKTPIEFSLHIESIVMENGLNHMEALIKFCEDNMVEPSEIKNLISKSLKDKLKTNFQDIGLLVKEAELPELEDE